jgi:hypothetical protein
MQYKILLHGESVASNPCPADLHESVEESQILWRLTNSPQNK